MERRVPRKRSGAMPPRLFATTASMTWASFGVPGKGNARRIFADNPAKTARYFYETLG